MRPLTCSCVLLLLLGRISLLALPLFSETRLPLLWSSTFPLNASALSNQSTALAHVNSLLPHDLVIWTNGSFPFKEGFGVLANGSLCRAEATLHFSAGLVCSSVSSKALQHQQVCHFFFSVSATLSSPPSFL